MAMKKNIKHKRHHRKQLKHRFNDIKPVINAKMKLFFQNWKLRTSKVKAKLKR